MWKTKEFDETYSEYWRDPQPESAGVGSIYVTHDTQHGGAEIRVFCPVQGVSVKLAKGMGLREALIAAENISFVLEATNIG